MKTHLTICICLLVVNIFLPGLISAQETPDEVGYEHVNGYLGNLGNSSRYVSIPHHNDFNQNNQATMEMWIYPIQTHNDPVMISKGATSSTQQFEWGIHYEKMYLRFSTYVVSSNGPVIPLNKWSHIAVSWYRFSEFTVIYRFYLNGQQNGNDISHTMAPQNNTDQIRIGAAQYDQSKSFNGYIDEFRFWNKQKPLQEIRNNRFLSLGDHTNSNNSNALTSATKYSGLISSYTFNSFGTTSAWDCISHHTGTLVGGANTFTALPGQPIPYNFVLKLPGGINDHVRIPDNNIFDRPVSGSIEAWIYTDTTVGAKTIIQKGATLGTQSFWFGLSAAKKLAFMIGNHSMTAVTTISERKWYHAAVTWHFTDTSAYTVKFYLNGSLDYTTNAMTSYPTNADMVWIGNAQWGFAYKGSLDEIRFWSTARTGEQIKQNMYTSGRALLPLSQLVGLWNFDGNLVNFSNTLDINGTFNNSAVNNAYLSAYLNEDNYGEISSRFEAYPTVINRNVSPNPFPQGFIIKHEFSNIFETLTSIINIPTSKSLTSIEVFLSIEHHFPSQLDIILRAPNNATRQLSTGNGMNGVVGGGGHILTIFVDGQTPVTNTIFMPPWSALSGPEQTMGNFGGTNIQGNWKLEITDREPSTWGGTLNAWGIRLNNSVDVKPVSSNIPDKFSLYQNYPNPFNPVTTIKFDIPKSQNVKLIVFDILGKEVKTLVNEHLNAGVYETQFDASALSSGTYFYRFQTSDFSDVKKLVLIK